MSSNHKELKDRVYQSLCHYGVAVFTDDIINPSVLALCGVHPPATGVELLEILIKLTQERKMVVWRDDEAYGFLPAKTWRREMAAVKGPLRAECQAMRLRGGDIAQLQTTMTNHIVSTVMPVSQLPDKPGNNTLDGGEKHLDKTPDNRPGQASHNPAQNGEPAGEKGIVPGDKFGESVRQETDGHLRDGSDAADIDY